MQLPLFDLPSSWTPPNMSDLPSWEGAKRIGLDTETHDPRLKTHGPGVRSDGKLVGSSFAIEDGPGFYLPFGHLLGDNLDRDQVLGYLRDQAKHYRGIIVGANLTYDLDYLAEAGITFPHATFRDIQIADPLINELHNSYSLDSCLERHGLPKKDETQLKMAANHYGVDPKAELWKLPARHVGAYAEWDAQAPLRLLRKQERIIDEQDLWQIYDLELKLMPVLLKMRRRGVRIDLDQLAKVEEWSLRREAEVLKEIRRLTGVDIGMGNIWTKAPLVKAIQATGYELTETTDSGNDFKLDKEVLAGIEHPVAELIVECRKVNKLRTTFAASIREHMVGDRIHCTFNQLRRTKDDGGLVGGRFGRMSSADPNLQQQPSRDEFADMWRAIYVPDGDIWACADYSQQEPRALTHFAELCNLPRAKQAAEAYRTDPRTDNHDMMTKLIHPETEDWDTSSPDFQRLRKYAKNIYLGLCYGMGGAKLARDLGLPTRWVTKGKRQIEIAGPEAQALLDTFNRKAPFVKGLADYCEEVAAKRGYIKTILGRRCRFPQLKDGSYDWTYKALNRLIQGSSADQTKAAVVALDEAGIALQLQVHDEVDWSPETMREAHEAKEIMEHCVEMNVPSRVDLEVGPNWGELEKAA